MAKQIKSCDYKGKIAAMVFVSINPGVRLDYLDEFNVKLVTDIEPKDLIYPQGWYYSKGSFKNKHLSTTGLYDEVPIFKTNGTIWSADYCTLYM